MIDVKCDYCKEEYKTYKAWYKKYKNHFCSRGCKAEWNKTIPGYWKGKKMPKSVREKMSRNHANVSGKNNPNWKGGRRLDKDGYILVWKPKHPCSDYHGYVREHRLVMEESIGRVLESQEVVHHEDGNKQNNKIENLKLFGTGAEHQAFHYHEEKNSKLKHSPKA